MIKIITFLLTILTVHLSAQTIPSTAEEIEKEYQSNIRKSRIDGIYIPQDIGDAIDEILRLSPSESIEKFKNGEENLVVRKLHFGLGKWLALKWNFEHGSRYSHYLKEMGISYPDDMISFTLRSLHRHLNGTPMELRERAAIIKAQRQKEHLERIQKGEVIDSLQRI
jgi:hypothetical protein